MDKKITDTICQKDENLAKKAAAEFINTAQDDDFKYLCEKMDFLFDFVRENVYKRLHSVINKDNFRNIFKFLKIYSPYFDDFFSSVFAKFANEELTDEILELLIAGSEAQKAYAAGYFKKIPDTVAQDDLIKNLSSEFEPLFLNCAAALGKMENKDFLENFKSDLNSEDDFKRLRAVKFLIAYDDKNLLDDLIKTLETGGMPENIAGEIANMISPLELLKTDFKNGALLFNFLICGLGEILPLDNVFYYEIYDVFVFLSQNYCPESSLLLLTIKNRFNTFTQNEEYTFDLDKNTKNEIFEIQKLIQSKNQDFWLKQRQNLKTLINENCKFLNTALEIIEEENFKEYSTDIAQLAKSHNETIICEAAITLKHLNELDKINKADIKIENPNLKAIFEQLF